MSIYRPLGVAECPIGTNASTCGWYRQGFDYAQDLAYEMGLFDPSLTPAFDLPTLPEAQTLLPAILSVLVVAFGARLIIQLVKKG